MRNRIAGENGLEKIILGEKFTLIKNYIALSDLEKKIFSKETNNNVYVLKLDENAKLLAVNYKWGSEEMPFLNEVDNVSVDGEFLVIGIDEKRKEYFKIE